MRNPLTRSTAAVATLLTCAAFLLPITMPCGAVAQEAPYMTNVVPDGGTGAIEGKISALDPSTRKLSVSSETGKYMTLNVAENVNMEQLKVGDKVEVEFSRSVFWVVTPPGAAVPQTPTHTVGQVAHTPGGIGIDATQISGRVVSIDPGKSLQIVNYNGGGVYTIKVTDPNKLAMLGVLHVGDAVTVSISPLTATSVVVIKCGWFGCS